MKEKNMKHTLLQRILSFLLVFVMVVGYIPARATAATATAVQKEADTSTLDRFESLYGTDTAHAGKVTVDKSVSTTGITIDDTNDGVNNGTSVALTDSNNFLVTVSQAAQVMALTTQMGTPVDVVFVMDTSGSMDDPVYDSNGNQTSMDRAETVIALVNDTIEQLLTANENNRVGVVAFSAYNTQAGTAGGDAANVLSTLAHYTGEAASNHLTYGTGTVNWGTPFTVKTVIGRSANGASAGSRYYAGGATNIQAGIAKGAELLMNASTTVDIDGQTVTRMPFLILLSDGAPVCSSSNNEWWNASMTLTQGTNGSPLQVGNSFLPLLTATYYKQQVSKKYYPNGDGELSVYTMGFAVVDDEKDMSAMTLNPADELTNTSNSWYSQILEAWNNYAANDKEFSITVGPPAELKSGYSHDGKYYFYPTQTTKAVSRVNDIQNNTSSVYAEDFYDVSGYNARVTFNDNIIESIIPADKSIMALAYNDDYFDVNDSDALKNAFQSILTEISKKAISSPTQVTTTEEFSGYVTFTDVIGEYMEVKDLKGILANGYFYRGANFAKYLTQGGTDEFNTTLQAVLKNRLSGTTTTFDTLLAEAKASENQAYYNGPNDYDNSIVWWGKTYNSGDNFEKHVQFVAPADNDSVAYIEAQKKADETNPDAIPGEGESEADVVCRSYFFYGEAGGDVADGEEIHEMMYFIVRVQRSLVAPYQQTVTISAPASLLSVDEVYITEDATGNTPTYTAEVVHNPPARVIYEVGLRSDINQYNIDQIVGVDTLYVGEDATFGEQAVNTNYVNGQYYFYTNDWDREKVEGSHERAMSKATFYAANNNSYYTYQANTYLYEKSGNSYTPFTGNPAGKTLYYYRDVYSWGTTTNSNGELIATKSQIPVAVTIPSTFAGNSAALKQDATTKQWYITPGTYTAAVISESENVYKGSGNNTDTSDVVAHPVRTGDADDSHYTVYLGNNGKLTMEGIDKDVKNVYKNLTGTTYPAEDDDLKIVKPGDILTYTVKIVNHESVTIDAEVTDLIPAGTKYETGSASPAATETKNTSGTVTGLVWNLNDIPAGETVTVSFQVKVLEEALHIPTVDNAADVELTLENGPTYSYTTNTTKNPVEGKTVTMLNGTAANNPVQVGDTLVYTINYVNDSDATATVTITDSIPKGTHYVKDSATNNTVNPNITLTTVPQGSNGDQVQSLQWVIANVQPHTEGTVNFSVVVDASAKINWPDNTNQSVTQPETGNIGIYNQAYIAIGNNDPRTTNVTQNTVKVGDLKITKALDGIDSTSRTFTIRLTEAQGKLSGTYVVYNGDVQSTVTFANGISDDLIIGAGETLLIKGLPDNADISVTELPATGYTPSYSSGGRVTIDAAKTGDSAVGVQVTNTYTPVGVTFQLQGSKTIFGDNFPNATFTFVARSCDSDGNLDGMREVVAYASTANASAADAEGKKTISFAFSPREFSAEQTLYYLVSEAVTAAGQLTGVTYDDTVYLMRLTISDTNDDGVLEATVAYKTGNADTKATNTEATDEWADLSWVTEKFDWVNSSLSFANTYQPVSVKLPVSGTKTLHNRYLTDNLFGFRLLQVTKDQDDKDVETEISTANVKADGENVNTGEFAFADITFTEAGTYVYRIREVNNNIPDMSYADYYYELTVVVEDDGGHLKIASQTKKQYKTDGTLLDENVTAFSFENTQNSLGTSIQFTGQKTLSGADKHNLAAGEFTFGVYKATIDTTNNKIQITDTNGIAGITVDDKFVGGSNVAAESNSESAAINFASIGYTPADMAGDNGILSEKDFYYVIAEDIPDSSNPTFDANMKYDATRYLVQVKVTYNMNSGAMAASVASVKKGTGEDLGGYTSVDITNSKGLSGYDFTNYKNLPYAEVQFSGTKTTTGVNLPDGLRFSFKVVGLTVGTDGALTVADEEGTGISAGTQGQLVTNGTDIPEGTKSSTDTITFTKLVYTKDDLGNATTNTLYYWIMESNTAAGSEEEQTTGNGVVYDTTRYLLKVTLSLNATSGQLEASSTIHKLLDGQTDYTVLDNYDTVNTALATFQNTYKADTHINLTATKTLANNRGSASKQFDFHLQRLGANGTGGYTLVSGSEIVGIALLENGATSATVNFGSLNYSTASLSDYVSISSNTETTTSTDGEGTETTQITRTVQTDIYHVYYLMSEVVPTDAAIPGVTYDPAKYLVTVQLTHTTIKETGKSDVVSLTAELFNVQDAPAPSNGVYTISQPDRNVQSGRDTGKTFANTYNIRNDASATITVKKELTGLELQENQFSFRLYLESVNGTAVSTSGTAVASATNAAGGTVTFTRNYPATMASSYFQPGENNTEKATFVYRIEEVNNALGGITYATNKIYAKVEVVHSIGAAELHATTVGYYSDAECTQMLAEPTFSNSYSTNEATYTPIVSKSLLTKDTNGAYVNKAMAANDFSFQVMELTYNEGTWVDKEVVSTGDNQAGDAAVDVVFTTIGYKNLGIHIGEHCHYYRISEDAGTAENTFYSQEEYYLRVTIHHDGQGTLTVMRADYFASIDNLANVNVPGDYYIVYAEKQTDEQTDVETIVPVQAPAYVGTKPSFINYYGTGKISLNLGLTKKVEIEDDSNAVYPLQGSEFDFEVYAYDETAANNLGSLVTYGTNGPSNDSGVAQIIFGDIVINKSQLTNKTGTFKYVVKEVARPGAQGIETDSKQITVTVTVTDDSYGNLTAVYTYSDNDTEDNNNSRFTNKYDADPVSVEILINKTLENRDIQDGMFTFELYEVAKDGTVSSTPLAQTVNQGEQAKGQAKFDATKVEKLTFHQQGTYYFQVREKAESSFGAGFTFDATLYTVVVDVKDNIATGKLSAEVSYYRDFVATASAEQNQTNKLGSIEFLNSYKPQPLPINLSTKIDATKTVVGANGEVLAGKAGGFEFEVLYSNGQPVLGADNKPITGKSGSNGDITFDSFQFTIPGEYVYRIHEKEVTATGYTMDTRVWEVRIHVRYNRANGELYIGDNDVTTFLISELSAQADEGEGNTQLQSESKPDFVNVYIPEPTTLTLYAQKNLEGREIKDHEFHFHLMEGDLIVAEGKNHAKGVVPFTVTYTEAGEHTYTVHEHKPETAEPGIVYDTNTYTVKVKVEDQNGKLVATVVDGTADLIAVFDNEYVPDPVTVPITAQKNLQGGKLTAGRFTFELDDKNGNVDNKPNAADGSITFEKTYDHEDMVDENDERITEKTFTYELREVKGEVSGMTYDETKFTVTVTVVDDLNGKLHASVSYSEIPVFTNIYDGKDAFEVVTAQKVLEGRALKDGEFTFELVDEAGKVYTATNDAKGNVTFAELQFSNVGTHTYTLREKAGTEANMTYDSKTYKVTITVTEDDNGDFQSTLKYDTADGKAPTFKNVYTPSALKVKLEGTKVLTGREMKAKEFKFQIRDSHGNLVGTGTNTSKGKIEFTDVTLPVAGKYELTVTEVDQGEKNMTYDTAKFQVVVNVSDSDNDGVLTAEVKYPEGGIKFENTYKKPEPTTEPTTEATTEPTTEPATEPTTEPTTEATTEPTTEPVTESTTEPTVPETTAPPAVSPDTGDAAPVGLFLILMVASGAGVLMLLLMNRKRGKYSR